MHKRSTARIIATALVGCALMLGLAAAAAQAEEIVTITKAGFSPDALGVPTNVFGAATFGSTNLPVPSPITHISVLGPPGLTLSLEGTGTCSAATLENVGPEGCPADSKAGFGGGVGAYEIAHEVINENFTVDFFLADNKPGHVELLIYLDGSTPVSIQLVFTAPVIQEPKPYGLGFSLNVPLIKVLPEASDASAISAFFTAGAKNIAYYKKVHGKRKLFHVKGIITPKTCPQGSWQAKSEVSFEDGTTVTNKIKLPCAKK
jgi:hypothetical protein